MYKPVAPACERNKKVILEVIAPFLQDKEYVLELGSGTGQHAVYFAKHLPHLLWQCSDLPDKHEGIMAWVTESALDNVLAPLSLDVDSDEISPNRFDAIFTANTLHIMSWESVEHLIEKVGHSLKAGGLLLIYGPFKFDGKFTSKSNEDFDAMLKGQDPQMGVRGFEEVNERARAIGLTFLERFDMPANNFILLFIKANGVQPESSE